MARKVVIIKKGKNQYVTGPFKNTMEALKWVTATESTRSRDETVESITTWKPLPPR